MKWLLGLATCCLAIVLLSGCNQASSPSAGSPGSTLTSPDKAKYVLTVEPAGAKAVMEVRQQAKDGDEIVVMGKIGGSIDPFVKGRAAFTIVDSSFVPCSAKEGDNCPTPWDFCCSTKEELARGTALIKVVDEQGQPVAQDAESLLGVKPLKTVVVRGRAKRDQAGNLTVLATGLYVRP
jgi:hypothetical protein